MNPTLYLVLALSAVLATNAYGELVRDIDGQPLSTETSYFVHPAIPSQGGGLYVENMFDAIAQNYKLRDGMPVRFHSKTHANTFVIESDYIHISMGGYAYWWVDHVDGLDPKQTFVVAGPNPKYDYYIPKYNSIFRVMRSGQDAYKFVHCFKKSPSSVLKCRGVGILEDNYGVRRLVLNDKPVLFKFVLAKWSSVQET